MYNINKTIIELDFIKPEFSYLPKLHKWISHLTYCFIHRYAMFVHVPLTAERVHVYRALETHK